MNDEPKVNTEPMWGDEPIAPGFIAPDSYQHELERIRTLWEAGRRDFSQSLAEIDNFIAKRNAEPLWKKVLRELRVIT